MGLPGLPIRVDVGMLPTYSYSRRIFVTALQAGVPCRRVDSRLRGNDVTFNAAEPQLHVRITSDSPSGKRFQGRSLQPWPRLPLPFPPGS